MSSLERKKSKELIHAGHLRKFVKILTTEKMLDPLKNETRAANASITVKMMTRTKWAKTNEG